MTFQFPQGPAPHPAADVMGWITYDLLEAISFDLFLWQIFFPSSPFLYLCVFIVFVQGVLNTYVAKHSLINFCIYSLFQTG